MRFKLQLMALAVGLFAGHSIIACDLQGENGWIREAPPGAPSIAAYGVLKNSGAKALEVTAISSKASDMAMLHESSVKDGISQMRMLSSVTIRAGGKLTLAPGGKHIMLTDPRNAPKAGEHVTISFTDSSGCVTNGDFTVRPLTAD